MKLTVESNGDDVTRINVFGDITLKEIAPGQEPMARLLVTNIYQRRLLLNMEAVMRVDSTGIGWMLGSHKRCVKAGGIVVFHSLPQLVDSMLRLLNLHTVLHLAADEATAMALPIEDSQ